MILINNLQITAEKKIRNVANDSDLRTKTLSNNMLLQ